MTVSVVLPLDISATKFSAPKKKRKRGKGYSLDGRSSGAKKHPDTLIAHIRWLHEAQCLTYAQIAVMFPEIKGKSQINYLLSYKTRHRINAAPCAEYMGRSELKVPIDTSPGM